MPRISPLTRHIPLLAETVACTALMLGALAASAQAAPGVNGKIAFTRHFSACPAFSNCTGAINAMNPDGTAQGRVSNWDSNDPYWSPDGERLAFASNWSPAAGESEIFLISAASEDLLNLTNNPAPDDEPAWSPDGTKIAFTSWRDFCFEIYVMNADGTGPTNLTKTESNPDHNAAWSPDSARIAYSSGSGDGTTDIYVMNADGSSPTNLTNHAASDVGPTWSPDGSRIAFASARDGNYEIYVMNADGAEQTRLTSVAATDLQPAWSPDGEKLAFVSVRDGNPEIYVMNADGANQTRLTSNPAPDDDPAWGTADDPAWGTAKPIDPVPELGYDGPKPTLSGVPGPRYGRPKLTLSVEAAKRQRALRRRSVSVRVGCGSVACKVKATGKLSVPRTRSTRKRTYTLRSARLAIAAGKRITLRLRLTASSLREARSALRARGRATVRVTVTTLKSVTASRPQTRSLKVMVTG